MEGCKKSTEKQTVCYGLESDLHHSKNYINASLECYTERLQLP